MATSSNGLDNLRIKVGRAYKHLQEFDLLSAKYCGTNPYRITKHDDLVNARHIVRCEPHLIEPDLVLSLADFVYALRSGLDQLAWQLALLGNPNPSRNTMFPIHPDQSPESENVFRKKVWDMPCEAVAIVKDLQPYKRGAAFRDDPLWQLNELSNIDKHRVPAGRAVGGSFTLRPDGWVRVDFDYGIEISWPLSVKDSVIFEPSIPVLEFGDPIDSAAAMPLELTVFQIAEIYRYVREDIIPRFARFFP